MPVELTAQQLQTGGAFSNKSQLPAIHVIEIRREYRPDPNDPTKMIEDHRVVWAKKGESGQTTSEKVARLKPKGARPAALEWAVIEPIYEAWLKGEEGPVSGTPLHAWAGIPREMVDELKKLKILSVEDLAELPDHKLSAIPFPSAREYRNRAKAYVDGRDGAMIGDKLRERDAKIERLGEENADLRDKLALMEQRINSLIDSRPAEAPEPAPVKRGPGRPRKASFIEEGEAA